MVSDMTPENQCQDGTVNAVAVSDCEDETQAYELTLEDLRKKLSGCVFEIKHVPMCIDRPKVIKALLSHFHIKTSVKSDRKDSILIYHGGRYEDGGDVAIAKIMAHAFMDTLLSNGTSAYSTHERNEILNRIRELTPTLDNEFDADLDIINVENGLFDWGTGRFMQHTPEYPSRIQIPVRYDPKATCPNIEKYFSIVFKPEDIPKIKEFIAYCLYRGYPIQKAFLLYGEGGVGKSIFISILTAFVGEDNTFSVSPQDLTKERFASADLYRKLLDASPDVGSEKLTQTAVLKALTGNRDRSRAERKFQDPFEFVNFAKMCFGFNAIPPTEDKTTGFYRRIEIVNMDHVLGENELSKEFIDSLTSPQELSGLFNICITMLPDLLKRNAFTNQMSRADAADKYEAISSPMEYFCEHFVQNDGEYVPKGYLFEYYQKFCKAAGAAVPKTGHGFGRYIHKCDWLVNRQAKDFVMRIGKSTVQIWPNTSFDTEAFNEWLESQKQ